MVVLGLPCAGRPGPPHSRVGRSRCRETGIPETWSSGGTPPTESGLHPARLSNLPNLWNG